MSGEIVPFGKHKGKSVEALLDDREYLDWLLAQGWFEQRYGNLYQIVINNGQEPNETPEHNAMQIKFLEEEYRLKFAVAVHGQKALAFASNDAILQWGEQVRMLKARILDDANAYNSEQNSVYEKALHEFEEARTNCQECLKDSDPCFRHKDWNRPGKPKLEELTLPKITIRGIRNDRLLVCPEPAFEEKMIDVQYSLHTGFSPSETHLPTARHGQGYYGGEGERLWSPMPRCGESRNFKIEIKPSVGDDYPAVLRQIDRYRKEVTASENKENYTHKKPEEMPFYLLLRAYTGIGATKEQFQKFFQLKNITVVFEQDVEAATLPPFDRFIDPSRVPQARKGEAR